LMGLESELGTLAAGKAADMLVLHADPLDDPQHLRHVAAVFKSGVRVA
jgi:imidazolonepropionase-like amidohydrolase